MAEPPVLEAAPGADKASAAAPAAAGKKRLLLYIVIGVIAIGGFSSGAWLVFGGKHDAKGKDKAHTAKEEAPKGPPIYVALDPPFVVNFETDELVRFLQITAQIMSRDPATAELIKANDPVVRNDLLLLMGNQQYKTVATREGKEKLRADALDTVRHVVAAAGGKPEHVEAVYFTSFVMQ